jgi:hypothetical protein
MQDKHPHRGKEINPNRKRFCTSDRCDTRFTIIIMELAYVLGSVFRYLQTKKEK